LSLVSYDLIPTFLVCFKVLQIEAQKSEREKQESNRKKREADRRLQRIAQKLKKVRTVPPVSLDIGADSDNAEDHEKVEKWQIRFKERNKGMSADFEQHVRCVLATGATARQAQDCLLLDANYMLPTKDAATLASSLPQLRWFQAQREALGIESYLYVFIRLAAASRVVQVRQLPDSNP
jgi:hypothetical protein